jgi:hypothetical protein
MVKWEYYTWDVRDGYGDRQEVGENVLDKIGAAGWELVSVTPNLLYIFKRPKHEDIIGKTGLR